MAAEGEKIGDPPGPLQGGRAPVRSGSVLKRRYLLEDLLAEGAMGSVWRALDRDLERPVAVKIPSTECLRDDAFKERFRREVERLIRLEHPHIVRLYDVGEHEGYPFAVIAFLEGGNLAERLARLGAGRPARLAPTDLAAWVAPVAEALDFIHARGVVHRDVKPQNVLFDATGNPYLADFGLSKARGFERSLTPEEFRVGTVAYLAPEYVSAREVSAAFDQYSLATTAFEMVTGDLPFSGGDVGILLRRRIEADAPRADAVAPTAGLAPDLVAALARALARDPARRFPSCGAFARALLRA